MGAIDRYACDEVFRRLDDYLDRELAPEEVRLVDEHLRTCAVCAAEYKFEGSVIVELRGKLRRLSVPEGLLERISRALEGT